MAEDRKEAWSLRIYQYNSGALTNIFFCSRDSYDCQSSQIIPIAYAQVLCMRLNLDLFGWTLGPFLVQVGLHISFADSDSKVIGL